MLTNLKALLVLLPIAFAVFSLLRPLCLKFMSDADFRLRRNLWFTLTCVAFLSPSFWLFALAAIPLIGSTAAKDKNPVALYLLLLQVIPPFGLQLPVVGINQLFELNSYRILAFALLIPALFRLSRQRDKRKSSSHRSMDYFILAYAVLQIVLLMPNESITNTLRRAFLFSIDTLALYFAASRLCRNRRDIEEALACFCLACAIYAPLAVFESLRGWQLYGGLREQWTAVEDIAFSYLLRGETLRALVSAGHPLALGYMMSMAFGFWLYLQSRVGSITVTWLGAGVFWAGLLGAYSRGPWLVAALVFFVFISLGPQGASRFVKAVISAAIIGALVLVSPIGERVIDNLPFIGTVDSENVSYRQRFAEISWQLIQANPLFGDSNILLYLEDLRQGQGIVDFINSYATIAMYYGLVGLFLFLGPYLSGMWKMFVLRRRLAMVNPEAANLGTALLACMTGTLFMMATGSFGTSLEKLYYVLAGLAAAYLQAGVPEPLSQLAMPGAEPRRRLGLTQ
ncbi:MAG: O-antigen ligase family protein [Betaproteobacteria bacterium]